MVRCGVCTRGSPLQAALRHYSTGHGGGAIIFVYIYSHLAEIDPGGKGGGGGGCFLCDSNCKFGVLSATHPISSPLILLWYCDRLLKVVFRFNELNVAAFVTASRIQILLYMCVCMYYECL